MAVVHQSPQEQRQETSLTVDLAAEHQHHARCQATAGDAMGQVGVSDLDAAAAAAAAAAAVDALLQGASEQALASALAFAPRSSSARDS